jgi:hypothetical protein
MLDAAQAADVAERLLAYHHGEMASLDPVYAYWTGRQQLPLVPANVPPDVRRLARMSRINITELVVQVTAQSLYVDGYRADPAESDEDAPAWEIWQRNRLDAHQTGVHRAAIAYGTSYVIVLPGDPMPRVRGVSPRSLVAMYDEDSGDWPWYALEIVRSPWQDRDEYKLYDEDSVMVLEPRSALDDKPRLVRADTHDLGVCPVIRFRNADTLNEPPPTAEGQLVVYTPAPTTGEVERLMPLQDQIDVTTLDLHVAQRFQSFRQRYIMGWMAESEEQLAKATAGRVWTFLNPETKVGEFGQVDLGGYLDSRESTIMQAGVISQTPGHELLGKLVNLSAEALVAAEVGSRRKLTGIENMFGESWEQMFGLAAQAAGMEVSDEAQVRWRDTEARSLSQTIDALGKLVQMLNVPPEGLWDRIPGASQQDIERWRRMAQEGDSLGALTDLLNRQVAPPTEPEGAPPAPTPLPVPA